MPALVLAYVTRHLLLSHWMKHLTFYHKACVSYRLSIGRDHFLNIDIISMEPGFLVSNISLIKHSLWDLIKVPWKQDTDKNLMHSQSERVVVWDLDDHNLKSLLANLRLKFIRESFIVIVCLIIINRDVLVQENHKQSCLYSFKCMYNKILYAFYKVPSIWCLRTIICCIFPSTSILRQWRGQGSYSLLTGTVSYDSVALST